MPSIPCKNVILCPGTDDPITNYSSEQNDGVSFNATSWAISDPESAIGPDPNNPNTPVGPTNYKAEGCLSTCTAATQALADLCAQNQAFLCSNTPSPSEVANGVTTPTTYYNTIQQATVTCPDGTAITWTVAAGYFIDRTQAAANARALAYATAQANANKICISDIYCITDVGSLCPPNAYLTTVTEGVNVYYFRIVVSGGTAPFVNWQVTSGAMPPGMIVQYFDGRTAEFSGIPYGIGYYTFTVRAEEVYDKFSNPSPRTISKTFEIGVMGITTTSPMTAGEVGVAYSQSLAANGGAPPYTYALTANALPTGLTISSAGVISGTPTAAGNYSFTITVEDGDGYESSTVLSIDVTNPADPCPDWDDTSWGAKNCGGFSSDFSPDSATGAVFSGYASVNDASSQTSFSQNTGTLAYSGSGCSCNLHFTMYYDAQAETVGTILIRRGALIIETITLGNGGLVAGDYDYPIALIDTGGVPVNYSVEVQLQIPGGGAAVFSTIEINGYLENV